jgi:hypothetical protein
MEHCASLFGQKAKPKNLIAHNGLSPLKANWGTFWTLVYRVTKRGAEEKLLQKVGRSKWHATRS